MAGRGVGSESEVHLAAPGSPRTDSAASPGIVSGTPTIPSRQRSRLSSSPPHYNYSVPSSSPRRFLSPITMARPNLYSSGGRQQPSSNSSSLSSNTHVSGQRDLNDSALSPTTTPPPSRSFSLNRSRLHDATDGAAASATYTTSPHASSPRSTINSSRSSVDAHRALARSAQIENDSMVYLDGPHVYTCGQCRTHLTSHDNIISKSFHGRHGRAYLFDQCVNVTVGPPEDRRLITGMHSVCDIFCKRCKSMVGWTYARAYEASQKYKEGKYIIEKINLYLEGSDYYNVIHPAGERSDRWRIRSMSWGSNSESSTFSRSGSHDGSDSTIVYEYRPSSTSGALSPYLISRSVNTAENSSAERERQQISPGSQSLPPAPPNL